MLWHTFGLTHYPRIEDWPVMPVDKAGFTFKPLGFFGRNPSLDVPESTSCHVPGEPGDHHHHEHHEHHHHDAQHAHRSDDAKER
ncbi:hypothetical protein [Luteimicrobium album]|uniref:copper amine oxidase n=1 Tax=Luteimicrobium album TaxID=1054550 RepID=UPI0032AEFAD2